MCCIVLHACLLFHGLFCIAFYVFSCRVIVDLHVFGCVVFGCVCFDTLVFVCSNVLVYDLSVRCMSKMRLPNVFVCVCYVFVCCLRLLGFCVLHAML